MRTPSGLHLAIEALGIKHSGGATVLKDLISAAVSDSRFARISVFCSPGSRRVFEFPSSSRLTEIVLPATEVSRLYRLWWLEHRLEEGLRKIDADVLLGLSGVGRARQTPYLPFIQQSLPFSAESLALMSVSVRLRMKALFAAMRRSCRASRGVLVQTCTMKKAIIEAFDIQSGRIQVFPSAVRKLDGSMVPSAQLGPMRAVRPGSRLLFIGNQSNYKNVSKLLTAVKAARRQWPDLTLFLSWPRGHSAGRDSGVVCLGYLQGTALAEAYELADLFVMPSLVETTGLPMLEAMTAGVPVLAADRPYAREVCEDAAAFFDPLEENDLAFRIIALLRDGSLREDLVRKGHALSEGRRQFEPYRKMLDAAARESRLS
jgi:glycosyltransferase involved in cell wall biosynthesis